MTPTDALEQLAGRLDALEQRVAKLERLEAEPERKEPARVTAAEPPVLEKALTAGTLNTAGIALLGIAGAYLLRAVSGTALLPRPAGACVAALYAAGWAYVAAKTSRKNGTSATLYALASLLMLGPMLWEMCIRFAAMPAMAGAALLAGYVAAVVVLARGEQQAGWFSLAYAGSAAIALAMAVGVRQMLPFAAILLAMAAWAEFSRLRGRGVRGAAFVWLAADVCAGALLLIYRLPAEARTEYPQAPVAVLLAAPLALLAMCMAGAAVRTCGRGERISFFDILQVSLALGLAGFAWIALMPQSGQAGCAVLCAVVAAGCYAAAFGRAGIEARNLAVFAAWAPALVVCGVFLALDAGWAAASFAVLAVGAAAAARVLGAAALAWHAALYVGLAEGAAGLLGYTLHAVAGPAVGGLTGFMMVAAVAAVAAYALMRDSAENAADVQVLRLVAALLAVWPLDALVTHALVRTAGQFVTPTAFHIALVRTVALCGLAVLAALAGSWWGRVELVRAAYTLTAFAALKLFFEDLRHGRLEFAAGSIFLVALALIAIPKMGTAKKRAV